MPNEQSILISLEYFQMSNIYIEYCVFSYCIGFSGSPCMWRAFIHRSS